MFYLGGKCLLCNIFLNPSTPNWKVRWEESSPKCCLVIFTLTVALTWPGRWMWSDMNTFRLSWCGKEKGAGGAGLFCAGWDDLFLDHFHFQCAFSMWMESYNLPEHNYTSEELPYQLFCGVEDSESGCVRGTEVLTCCPGSSMFGEIEALS